MGKFLAHTEPSEVALAGSSLCKRREGKNDVDIWREARMCPMEKKGDTTERNRTREGRSLVLMRSIIHNFNFGEKTDFHPFPRLTHANEEEWGYSSH